MARSILYQFPDKRDWSQIAMFHTPAIPRYGDPRRNIAIPFGVEKLEWCGCHGEKV